MMLSWSHDPGHEFGRLTLLIFYVPFQLSIF